MKTYLDDKKIYLGFSVKKLHVYGFSTVTSVIVSILCSIYANWRR